MEWVEWGGQLELNGYTHNVFAIRSAVSPFPVNLT
jgi:hypothetical protein